MIKRGGLINVMSDSGGTHLCLITHVKAERTHEEFFVTHALKRCAVVDLQRAEWKHRTSTALRALRHGACHVMHQTLHHLQHGHVIAESLIRLHGGEFRVVAAINAFIAEVAIDFKDFAHAAHHESLQIELRRNAQKELHIKGVMRGHKRTRRRTAGNRLHHGGLYLQIAARLHEAAHQADNLRALLKGSHRLRICEHVHVPLAIANLCVFKTVPLSGRRSHALGGDLYRGSPDARLALVGAADWTFSNNEVAVVEHLGERKLCIGNIGLTHGDLQVTR